MYVQYQCILLSVEEGGGGVIFLSCRRVTSLVELFCIATKNIDNMADWEEVKRLAADFQQAQLSSSKQK